MKDQFELDQNLRPYATDRQWELLSAWAEHGTTRAAAEALGIHKSNIDRALKAVLKNAALRGYAIEAPQFDGGGRIPAGFVLKGQSVLLNAAGEMSSRWDKTKQEGLDPDEARKLPDPKKTVKLSTLTDAEGRVIQQWVAEKPEDVAREQAWIEFAHEMSKDIPRVEPTPAPKGSSSQLMAGYPVGDHHLGMLAWHMETGDSYDMKIGESLLKGAFDYLTQATASAEHGLIVFLGDFLHYDSFETITPTSRNMLDSDTRYPKLIWAAVRVMRYAIGSALAVHQHVHVIVEAGNHDLSSTVFLGLCLSIAYENEPRVTIDGSPMHYHYHRFGQVLLGTHHGHGTKMQNLPLLMAADRPEDWGATKHRVWWTGHVHQGKTQAAASAEDFSGCTVERFRVLPPTDAWAAQKGYRPHRDMKAIVFHSEYGEVARHTVNPQMLEGGSE